MGAVRLLFDLLIYLEVLGLLFAFSHLIRNHLTGERVSYYLFFTIWSIQLVYVAYTISSQFDPLFFYAWMLMSFALALHHFHELDGFVFCTYLCSLVVLSIYLFLVPNWEPIHEQMVLSELVFVHATLAWSAYASFTLAGICAMLYLCNHYLLKRKKWNLILKRLTSLHRLQVFIGWLAMVGVWLLVVSLILGTLWGLQILSYPLWMDAKIWSSAVMLLIYSVILYQWGRKRWHGQRLAWWCLSATLLMVVNYLISRSSISFHHWL